MNDFLARLREAVPGRVRSEVPIRAAHCRDSWVLGELHDLEGIETPLPRAVVEAESTQEVATVLRLCREKRVPIVTYGGGSGVCGAIRTRGGEIVLSTARLAGLVDLDADNLTATFRAGTNGLEAERRVQQEGLTIGHWPQSIERSTVGGWVATRAAGQFSTAYGNIEELVLDLEAVLPNGEILRTRRTPRAAAGPDLRHLLLGSEGTLGVVTEVTFSLRSLPGERRGQAIHFPDLGAGLDAIRRVLRAGWRPPVMRLYDVLESKRNFDDPCPGRTLLLMVHEGPAELVSAQLEAVSTTADGVGGRPAPAAIVDRWLEHRNRVPGFRVFLEKGIILDTVEVAATWNRVLPLYERVLETLQQVPGILSASAHSSHSYRSGTNLYFTFLARPARRSELEKRYIDCWRRVMEATVAEGGGLAHHHGIGRVRRDFLRHEIGDAGVALLRRIKRALDPEGLLNPGALLPDDAP